MASNDLIEFMLSATREMQEEYERIQKRAKDDPGTAGDQGEENWAKLLRNWLPPTFQVVTKGRLLSVRGIASPQIDVLVLRPEYPKQLLDKKLYLSDGVLAAFECKVTLKAHHIKEFMENSLKIKNCFTPKTGTVYKEINTPIVYGLLAHSHSWKIGDVKTLVKISERITEFDAEIISHPRLMPDLLCIADLAYWNGVRYYLSDSDLDRINSQPQSVDHQSSHVNASYVLFYGKPESPKHTYTPIGGMLTHLMNKIGWEYPGIRSLASYFSELNLPGNGTGFHRVWDLSIISSDILMNRIIKGEFGKGDRWDEWNKVYL